MFGNQVNDRSSASIRNGVKKRVFLLQIWLCFIAFTLIACSSEPLLGIVKPANLAYATSTFGLFDINTFDVYLDKNTIHVLAGGKISAKDKQIKIRYVHSEDGGRHWDNPRTINDDFPTSSNSRGNDIQIVAKDDRLFAIWQTKGELPGMGPMVSAYSQDNGKTWQQGSNPAVNNAGDQSHFDLLADQQGHFHVVWLEDPEENGYQSLRYAKSLDNGKQWTKPVTLDDSTCSCCWNTFALSPEDQLNLLYRDMKPRDMALLQSSDNGANWQRASTVGEFGWQFDGCPHTGGGLTVTGGNQIHSVVWTGVEQKSGLYYLSSNDSGKHWSLPKKMGNTAIHADIAALDNQHVAAIWDEMEADGSSIFYAKSEDGGVTWSTPIRLAKANKAATHPRLIATSDGYLALWTEKPSKQPSQLAWQIIE